MTEPSLSLASVSAYVDVVLLPNEDEGFITVARIGDKEISSVALESFFGEPVRPGSYKVHYCLDPEGPMVLRPPVPCDPDGILYSHPYLEWAEGSQELAMIKEEMGLDFLEGVDDCLAICWLPSEWFGKRLRRTVGPQPGQAQARPAA